MSKILSIVIIIFFLVGQLHAQEKLKYSTGPNPKSSPIFPGCERFKENNDSLNSCFRIQMAERIAQKMNANLLPDKIIDSTDHNILKTKLIIDVTENGHLKMKLFKRVYTEFEDTLVLKLNELCHEISPITPAKFPNNKNTRFRYQLPLTFIIPD